MPMSRVVEYRINCALSSVVNSWVDIVKFGQTKPVVALCKGRAPPQKVKKAVVALPMVRTRIGITIVWFCSCQTCSCKYDLEAPSI